MSGYLNKASLIGNLGQDPEVRHMQNGGAVVTLSVATSEGWTDSNTGERRERTEWHKVVIFNEGLGKVIEKHLTKGSKIYVEGQIRTRKWQDQEGRDRYSTEIHLTPYNGSVQFLSPRKDEDSRPAYDDTAAPATATRAAAKTRRKANPVPAADPDDEVPF